MFTGTGATKSLTSAGNAADERLLRNALPNASQVPGGKTPAAVRLMAASPNLSAPMLFGVFDTNGSVTASRLLTAPIELLLFRVIWSPQHGNELADRQTLTRKPGTLGVVALVSHRSNDRVGLPPPLVKSKVTSRSPAVRLSSFGPAVRFGWAFWLISKSMLAEPRLLVRSHARYRKLLP